MWNFQIDMENIWEKVSSNHSPILSTYAFNYLKRLLQCLLLIIGNQSMYVPVLIVLHLLHCLDVFFALMFPDL